MIDQLFAPGFWFECQHILSWREWSPTLSLLGYTSLFVRCNAQESAYHPFAELGRVFCICTSKTVLKFCEPEHWTGFEAVDADLSLTDVQRMAYSILQNDDGRAILGRWYSFVPTGRSTFSSGMQCDGAFQRNNHNGILYSWQASDEKRSRLADWQIASPTIRCCTLESWQSC